MVSSILRGRPPLTVRYDLMFSSFCFSMFCKHWYSGAAAVLFYVKGSRFRFCLTENGFGTRVESSGNMVESVAEVCKCMFQIGLPDFQEDSLAFAIVQFLIRVSRLGT